MIREKHPNGNGHDGTNTGWTGPAFLPVTTPFPAGVAQRQKADSRKRPVLASPGDVGSVCRSAELRGPSAGHGNTGRRLWRRERPVLLLLRRLRYPGAPGMITYLEVWKSSGPELVPLAGERVIIGRAQDSDVVLPDRRVSAVHAVLEQVGPHWCVRDVGSRNGTFLNGERLLTERVLEPGDEVRLGDTRLVFRTPSVVAPATTEGAVAAPRLTGRERDVLLALCRPLGEGSLLTEPASVTAIAAELFLTESAVKKHLANLYDKFGLYDEDRRRGRLANEAVTRGAVQLAELRRRAD